MRFLLMALACFATLGILDLTHGDYATATDQTLVGTVTRVLEVSAGTTGRITTDGESRTFTVPTDSTWVRVRYDTKAGTSSGWVSVWGGHDRLGTWDPVPGDPIPDFVYRTDLMDAVDR